MKTWQYFNKFIESKQKITLRGKVLPSIVAVRTEIADYCEWKEVNV